jgi:hypothetical protein
MLPGVASQRKVFAAGFLLLTSQLASFNLIWYSKYLYNVSKLERVSLDFPKESPKNRIVIISSFVAGSQSSADRT